MSQAFAHGVGSGSTGEGYGPLILLFGIIIFILFLVLINRKKGWTVLVTGGAGYVGSALVPHLLKKGHHVRVLDLYTFGEHALKDVRNHVNLLEIKGDIRDLDTIKKALKGCNAVIHLAGASNENRLSINSKNDEFVTVDAFTVLVRTAKAAGVKRFIYTSSACVYGPITGESAIESDRFEKASELGKHLEHCETILGEESTAEFVTSIVRTGHIFGYAPICHLDIPLHALTYAAVAKKIIKVSKSAKNYPSIHVKDVVGLFVFLLGQPNGRIDGETFNAVTENHSLLELANVVRDIVDSDILLEDIPPRGSASQKVSSKKMYDDLGFLPRHSLGDAVKDLITAFNSGEFKTDFNHRSRDMIRSP
ncbi:MAG: UDP-glucose 4-epimerase [Magnetovibrio sp.]|nr:UDP-glucose 4-epimerase [Magnetovibrio sp.]